MPHMSICELYLKKAPRGLLYGIAIILFANSNRSKIKEHYLVDKMENVQKFTYGTGKG
jgi:hypothetical protein